ncbi:MAG: hypothetical protein VX777_08595 [Chlamydiota bacterium]|nr:hypothetical protein [Chlamydiota bacterium]
MKKYLSKTITIVLITYNLFGVAYTFDRPEHVSENIWNSILPHLISESHPMKKTLDEIFHSNTRVVFNSKSLKKAGFKNTKPGKWSGTIVATHKKLKGYLVKMYTDDQKGYIDWAKFIDRVKGAKSIKKAIEKNGWNNIFKVPNKWIYPLPESPAPPIGYSRKNFVLLVEDMDLLPKNVNLRMWRGAPMKKTMLNAIFLLLKEEGLRDSVYAFNLPFSKDKKIALVDTEYHHIWPVHYLSLLQYLSPSNREYWKQLVKNGGPNSTSR